MAIGRHFVMLIIYEDQKLNVFLGNRANRVHHAIIYVKQSSSQLLRKNVSRIHISWKFV